MKVDYYTRAILTLIAICLMILTLQTVPLAPKAVAAGYTSCTGELKANVWGGIEASIGGYKVNIQCN